MGGLAAFYILTIFTVSVTVLTAQKIFSPLFPYGVEEGDKELPRDDDGLDGPIAFPRPFRFLGREEYHFYINTNGVVSLEEPIETFYPQQIPFWTGKNTAQAKLIAPFFTDVSTEVQGSIFWREVNKDDENDYIFRRSERLIRAAFSDQFDFSPDFIFIVTWDRVAFFGATNPSAHTNTFQAVLLGDGFTGYVIFNYGDITWHSDASENSKASADTGLGGIESVAAKVGFNLGDGRVGYSLPISGSYDVVDVETGSNMGMPGRYIFDITEKNVIIPDAKSMTECPPGWQFFNEEYICFVSYKEPKLNFEHSRKKCEEMDANLVSVTTESINTFLATEVTGGKADWTWIGGQRFHGNDTWRWLGGEAWFYTNWRTRGRQPEPNNWGGRERCLHFNFVRDGWWNDHFCDRQKSYICQITPRIRVPQEESQSSAGPFSSAATEIMRGDLG